MKHNSIDSPDSRELTRREFSVESLMALFAGIAITVTACGSDSSPTAPNSGDEVGSVSANHGHSATVTSVQLTAGNTVTVDVTRGTGDHAHTLVLSAAEVIQIRDGQRVSKDSSTDASAAFGTHLHTVTFN
jgi:hypothetical protein